MEIAARLREGTDVRSEAERLRMTGEMAGDRERDAGLLPGRPDTGSAVSAPIAVIGIGCRLPGGLTSPELLWRAVLAGADLVTDVPAERWDAEAIYDPEPGVPGRTVSRRGGFYDDFAGFDLSFFGMGRPEAEAADPQQRILLEVAWEAIEHAGIAPAVLAGSSTGVFAGISNSDYLIRHRDAGTVGDAYAETGVSHAVASGRIAYLLDLRGPAMTVDTACSSSLVAIHLASQSLRSGECDLALAGGVTVNVGPEHSVGFSQLGMMSPKGLCQAFSEGADGFVRSEGCGVLLLKRLPDAVAAGDRILAVLRGSAVNQDGRSLGLAAPTVEGQAGVQSLALKAAGIDPAAVAYVEAHGTGTPVGDPIELEALARSYGAAGPCAVGSVKTNLGHTEPAAGVVGLIKAIQAVRYGIIPPNLHFTGWGPGVDPGRSGLYVPTSPAAWPAIPGPRTAAVSSYGFSGTNAHLLLEQAPDPAPAPAAQDGPWLFPVSSTTPKSLAATAAALAEWVAADETELSSVAYTLARRRSHRPARAVVVASCRTELACRLRAVAEGLPGAGTTTGVVHGRRPGTVWVFSGQGSQHAGMAAALLTTEPAFAAAVDELEPLLAAEAGFSLREALTSEAAVTGMGRVQPVLFAIQVALAATWRSHGVEPAAVIGHSMGEAAAAVVAGGMSLRDGVAVICRRSRLLATLGDAGTLGSVDLPAAEVEAELADVRGVVIGVVSSPGQTVVSGDTGQVRALLERWQDRGLMAREVAAPVASHSPQMDPILPALRDQLASLAPAAPAVRVYGTVLDDPREIPSFDAQYWTANLRRPVRFMAAVQAALDDGHRTFVELSPHPLLTYAITETAAHARRDAVALPSLRRDEDARQFLLTQVGAVHCADGTVDWTVLPDGELADVPLPEWQHEHLLITPDDKPAGQPLLAMRVRPLNDTDPHVFQGDVGLAVRPWLADHKVHGVPALPGAAYAEMALAAGLGEVSDLTFHELLLLSEHTEVTATVHGDRICIETRSEDGERVLHATARLCPRAGQPEPMSLGACSPSIPRPAQPRRFTPACRLRASSTARASRPSPPCTTLVPPRIRSSAGSPCRPPCAATTACSACTPSC